MSNNMVKVEIQYFEGCPHADEMIERVKIAAAKLTDVEYKLILVDTPEKARKYKFRGSPTLLINGVDLEGMPEAEDGNLCCRYYKNGLPELQTIIEFIEQRGNQ
jgi:hypothetical protein